MQTKNYENALFESIYLSTRENVAAFCNEKQVDYIFNKISKNKEFIKSICLLPYWFFNCFENKENIDIQNELFILGKSNFQAVIAYTIYDYLRDKKIDKDYIDISLSVANILMQKSLRYFYEILKYDKQKIGVLDNIINMINISYIDNRTVSDIHYHFKYLCDNNYKKSIGLCVSCLMIIWFIDKDRDENNQTEILSFFENYLNARQLSDDEEDMCDDMLNNIYTPATFLMRAQYSSDYIHSMIRTRIDTYMRSAVDSLKNISFFDYEKFIELYVKDC